MNIFDKIKWIIGISMVIALIMITNLMDKKHFAKIKNSVITIYEDRLLAKNIVFELSHLMHEKEMASALSNVAFYENENRKVNKKMDELIHNFSTTKLTVAEEKVFANLQSNIAELKTLEKGIELKNQEKEEELSEEIKQVQKNLLDLSAIQLAEGKQQLIISRDAVNQIEFFTKIENYMLITLAVLMVLGVIYQPKKA